MIREKTQQDMHAITSIESGWRATDVFLFVLSALIILLFYSTPLHEQTENLLFDAVSVTKPKMKSESPVVIVESGAVDTAPQDPNHQTKDQTVNHSDPHRLLPEMQSILADQSVKILVVLLYPNFFSYTDPHLEAVVDVAFADPRVHIGILGIDTEFPSVRRLPDVFGRVSERVLGMETFRIRRQQTIRQMPLNGFRGMTPTLMLAPSVVEKIKPPGQTDYLDIRSLLNRSAWAVHWYRPNYRKTSELTVIKASELIDQSNREKLRDKIVLLGPMQYRERPINNEQLYVNTPWQREGNDPMYGETLAALTAVTLENLLKASQLRSAPLEIGWIAFEVLLIILLFSMPWRRGIIVAVAVIAVVGALILFVHGVLMSYFSIYLPMHHTMLMGTLSLIAGGIWRVRYEAEMRLSEQARSDARAALARVQGRFLNRFASELAEINRHILNVIQDVWPRLSSGKNSGSLAQKLRESSQEFDDYLKGIRQFADLPDGERVAIKRSRFKILEMVNRILANFETRREQHGLKVKIEGLDDVELHTDQTMVEAVLFNLISNAFKYTPDGGDIVISAQRRGKNLMLSVYNSGPGIKTDFHDKIFERFYRVQDAHTTGIKGNGLGLYLCRYFAGLLGGSVTVSSQPDQGVTFVFTTAGAK